MLIHSFKKLQTVRVLVLGDFMVDRYIFGHIDRISPEAPVPIMRVKEESARPGGAGNVALNLRALGAEVSVIGVIGDDFYGRQLLSLLGQEKIDCSHLILDPKQLTIVKSRLMAGSQHVIRLDEEHLLPLSQELEETVASYFSAIISHFDIVAFSDYAKGFFTPSLLKKLIVIGNQKGARMIVDPKGEDFSKYRGVFTLKPNLKEAYHAAKLPKEAPLIEVANALLKQTGVNQLIITRSEKGISLFTKGGNESHFPVKAQEVVDVTGAGDTVLATLVFALASGLDLEEAIELANIASGIAVSRLGCAHITQKELAKKLLEEDYDNKIFEEHHLALLLQVIQDEPYIVATLEGLDRFTLQLLEHIRRLKDLHRGSKVLLYIRQDKDVMPLASILSSFKEIDYLILAEESDFDIYAHLKPEAIYTVLQDSVQKVTV